MNESRPELGNFCIYIYLYTRIAWICKQLTINIFVYIKNAIESEKEIGTQRVDSRG